jgi:predicted MFS family arabinose efflux permease
VRKTHGAESGTHLARRVELIILSMAFTTFAYVSLSVSLCPLLTAIADDFGVSESAVGQLATISGIVATISALASAPWMGRYSRRTWLRAELGLLMAAVLVSALAPSFPVMVLGRILIGIAAGALMANCFTAASEVVTDRKRQGRAVGIVASGTTIAVLAGLPAIAFLDDHFGWRWALGCLLIPLGVSLAGTALLPARKRGSSGIGDGHEEAVDRGLARTLVRNDRVTVAIMLATGSIFVAYIGWITYYSAYVEHDFAGGAGRIGVLFIVGGLAELIGNFGAPALSHRAPVRWVALLGMAGMAVALLGSGVLFRSMGGLFVGIALLHLCTSFAYVGLNTLLVHRPDRIRGTVMALSSAAVGLGGALGALIGGVVLALTDDYLPVFHVLGALLACGAIGLSLVFRSAESSAIVDSGAPLWSE